MRIPAKKVFLEPFLLVGVSGRQNCTPVRSGAKRLLKERFGGSPAATQGRLKCSECPSSRDSRCWDWGLAPSRGYTLRPIPPTRMAGRKVSWVGQSLAFVLLDSLFEYGFAIFEPAGEATRPD